jgi:hypothetical protein
MKTVLVIAHIMRVAPVSIDTEAPRGDIKRGVRGRHSARSATREANMLGLTSLGTVHTVISLIALAAGFVALARHQQISTRARSGVVFVGGTVLSCLSGLGIFQHGGFGNPHVLAIVTLVVLGVAYAAEYRALFGALSRYVATVSYSLTFFFHFIPGTVETLTRLPAGAPYLANPDDPKAQPIIGLFFLLFLVGATLQVLRLRAARIPAAA